MIFTDLRFIAFLIPAVIVFYGLPIRWRCPYLLILSWLFYCTWSVPYSFLLLFLTLLVYFLAIAAERASSHRAGKLAAIAAVVLLIGVLTIFKSLPHWKNASPGWIYNLAIPLGISYYTFKLVSYVLDVYWGTIKAERHFPALALYVAFFPQIVSGPIQRAPDFIDQLRTRISSGFNGPMFDVGVGFVLLGFLEKVVIADRIAPFIAEVDRSLELQSQLTILLSAYCYTFQLFADLSALTLIALGIGMLFGIQGPPNFHRPFAAANIPEFWRSWHKSLTGWLADYLFLPLRMAFRKWGKWGLSVSIVLNMAIIGGWHGFTSSFLAFGLIHGVYVVSSSITATWRNNTLNSRRVPAPLRRLWGQVVTFHLVTLAFVFFRSPTPASAVHVLRRISMPGSVSVGGLSPGDDVMRSALAASSIAIILGYGLFSRNLEDFLPQTDSRFLYMAYGIALFTIVLLGVVDGGQFIYARF